MFNSKDFITIDPEDGIYYLPGTKLYITDIEGNVDSDSVTIQNDESSGDYIDISLNDLRALYEHLRLKFGGY